MVEGTLCTDIFRTETTIPVNYTFSLTYYVGEMKRIAQFGDRPTNMFAVY